MKKKIIFALVLALLLPLASAFSISPASAEIGKLNNTLALSVINSSDNSIKITLNLGDFKKVAKASRKEFILLPRENSTVRISFYDGISHKDKICFSGSSVSGNVGSETKNCTTITVNTTNEKKPADTLDGFLGDNFISSQLIIVDDILISKINAINTIKERQLFEYYDELNPLLLQLTQKRNEVSQSVSANNITAALKSIDEFYSVLEEINSKEPLINVIAAKNFDYFVSSGGSQILDPSRLNEIRQVLKTADLSNEAQFKEVENQANKVKTSRSLLILEVVDRETGEQFNQTNINISLTNLTSNRIPNVKVIEFLPKTFALDISNVTIFSGSDIIQSDPVFELSAGDLEPGVKKKVFYKISDKIREQDFDQFKLPVVSVRGVRELKADESKEILGEVLDELVSARKSEFEAIEGQSNSNTLIILSILLGVVLLLVIISINPLYKLKKIK